MVRRNVVTVALVITVLVAAWLVLGAPAVGEGMAFFTAGIPTMATAEAVMALLAWVVIVVAACTTVVSAFGDVTKRRQRRKTYPTASMLLVVGLLLFAFGAVQRALPASSICCGSGSVNLREAIQLAR